jgi:hypothetical protein
VKVPEIGVPGRLHLSELEHEGHNWARRAGRRRRWWGRRGGRWRGERLLRRPVPRVFLREERSAGQEHERERECGGAKAHLLSPMATTAVRARGAPR